MAWRSWPTTTAKPSRRNFAPWPYGRSRALSGISSIFVAASMSGTSPPAFADLLREKCTSNDIEVPRLADLQPGSGRCRRGGPFAPKRYPSEKSEELSYIVISEILGRSIIQQSDLG